MEEDYETAGPARVRVVERVAVRNAELGSRGRVFEPGEVVDVVRWGEDRDRWWTSYDVDGAYSIPPEKVEVVGRSTLWDPLRTLNAG